MGEGNRKQSKAGYASSAHASSSTTCTASSHGAGAGGSSGISVGHVSPEAAAGGTIGLVEDGDEIEIDVETRVIRVNVPDAVLAERRAKMEARENPWQPVARDRYVSPALQAYAAMATSADRGAVRDVSRIRRG